VEYLLPLSPPRRNGGPGVAMAAHKMATPTRAFALARSKILSMFSTSALRCAAAGVAAWRRATKASCAGGGGGYDATSMAYQQRQPSQLTTTE